MTVSGSLVIAVVGGGSTISGCCPDATLNRALLARQGLLEAFDDPLPGVLHRIGGIQAQYAPSMYVGLWSRMRTFARADLTRALEDRTAVQGTPVRGLFERNSRALPPRDEIADLAERLRSALVDGPLRQREIDELVGRDVRGWVTSFLALVRVPPSGTWERRRADLYGDAAWWIGRTEVPLAEARALLVRRYLGGFGPATLADIASWAGLRVAQVSAALEHVDHAEYEAADGSILVDLPGAPLPDPDVPAGVRFLPTWDATLLAHARRTQILPEEHRWKIFSTKTPHSFPTFLVDGAVAGTWRYERGDIHLTEFEPLPRSVRRSVGEAKEALLAFHG